jgi:hypothetical protein
VQAADPTAVPPVTPPPVAQPPLNPASDVEPRPAPPPAPRKPTSTWDPRKDLLPYHDADELDDPPPVTGKAWIAWVAAAVVLVGLVFVLLDVLATDPEDDGTATEPTGQETSPPDEAAAPEESPEEAPEESPEVPTGVGKRTDLARQATFGVPDTAPPTTDFDGNLVAYEAVQMGDGLPSTAWRMAGDATGQTVTVTLAQPSVIGRVGLINGYAKQVAGVNWYPNNRRILAVRWGFDDGTTIDQTFAERPEMQMLKVPPVQSNTVTITINSVTPPGSGNLGRDYTAISEVSIIGRRAG